LVRVDPQKVVSPSIDGKVGINVNYLRDGDERSRPISDAMAEMGVRHLRYPGGEKSDWVVWNRNGVGAPVPVPLGYYATAAVGHKILDFDRFISFAREAKAEPHVVVAYDSFARTGVTKEQYLRSAIALLTYANIERGYGVVYWEIGNENWHNGTGSGREVAEIVVEFSRAMKKIDPSIKVGASGNTDAWWHDFLPIAADDLDFLTVSQYSCTNWGSYNYYHRNAKIDLVHTARGAVAAIDAYAPGRRDRIEVVISEFNSMDYSERPWPKDNTLAHALVTFDILAQSASMEKVSYAMLWNTRWMEAEKPDEIWYALGRDNELLPPGQALAAWGRFAHGDLVRTAAAEPIVAYCAQEKASGNLTVFVINKGLRELEVEVAIGGEKDLKEVSYEAASAWSLSGDGPGDLKPRFSETRLPQMIDSRTAKFSAAPVSLTVLVLERR
jgi:alpha-L-arabinofuranosidase